MVQSLRLNLKNKTCLSKIFYFLNRITILLPLNQLLDQLFVVKILQKDHILVQVMLNQTIAL